MGILVRCKLENGKTKVLAETESEKESIKSLKQFGATHEGVEFFKYYLDKEEVVMDNNLPRYYKMIMLEPLYKAMKETYGFNSISDCDAALCTFFNKEKRTKSDGTTYEIAMRISEVPLAKQIAFISKVANLAITKYGIKYPNANEVAKM